MDIPRVLVALGLGGEDWGPGGTSSSTYADLAAGWRGSVPVPAEATMEAKWLEVQAGAPLALTQQQREQAKAILDTLEALGKILRGEADVFKDEFNVLRRQVVGVRAATWNPLNMPNNTGLTSPAVGVPGAAFGDFVCVAAPYDLAGVIATAYVAAADQVRVRLQNATGGAVDLPSGDWKVVVWRPEEMPPRDLGQLRTAIRSRLDSGSVDAPPP